MLSRAQFAVLTALESAKEKPTQRMLAAKCGLALGTVNKTLAELADAGAVSDMTITDVGLESLEPYRVRRAIFLAAGFGSRLVPVTLNTPKPLVRVNGTRIIDTLLDAVTAADIPEIVIVRGYLGEQFDVLRSKYPRVTFRDNPLYNESNNISSAYAVRDLLENSYVMEADLLLRNPALVTKYQYCSNYLGVPVERTDDWCFRVANGRIVKVGIGGERCHHMFGISYWDAESAAKLCRHLDTAFHMPGGRERYWDQVALEIFAGEYRVEVRECTFDDIVEIDTFRDLKALDGAYEC